MPIWQPGTVVELVYIDKNGVFGTISYPFNNKERLVTVGAGIEYKDATFTSLEKARSWVEHQYQLYILKSL